MAPSYPSDEELLNIHFEDEDDDRIDAVLCIIDFENVDEAIAFALEHWPDQAAKNIETMRVIQAEELEEGDAWLCMTGVCDICGAEGTNFLPAAVFEDEIVGTECFCCGNMSMYPKER